MPEGLAGVTANPSRSKSLEEEFWRIPLLREDQDAVGWQHEIGGVSKVIHWILFCEGLAGVANSMWIDPAFVNIAIEDFSPRSVAWEADPISKAWIVAQVNDYDDILAAAWNPSMVGENSILIVSMDYAKSAATQGG